MSTNVSHAVYTTTDHCGANCGTLVYRLDPPMDGWSHYCPSCAALVLTDTEVQHSIHQPLPAGAIGRVMALPLKEPLRIEPFA